MDGRNNLRWLSLRALDIACPAIGGHYSGIGAVDRITYDSLLLFRTHTDKSTEADCSRLSGLPSTLTYTSQTPWLLKAPRESSSA
ncbi:hypothetical protein PoB_006911700 [Plakobranchus ocellatus]|uniref:Uncharacterized protein n=1 Tax=Plakobranchus ocellatus TaxID=259542 RepID=A0AAV4DEE6_9GAST|nr:hypothetical protein PoB_006911700 [Plakobranchus ocellatus]